MRGARRAVGQIEHDPAEGQAHGVKIRLAQLDLRLRLAVFRAQIADAEAVKNPALDPFYRCLIHKDPSHRA